MKPTNDKIPYESRSLDDLNPILIPIVEQAEKEFDAMFPEVNVFTSCTHRNGARQNQLFAQTKPRVTWAKAGQSPHNRYPSDAWDVAVINNLAKKLDWNIKYFDAYTKIVRRISKEKGVDILSGSDWNNDGVKDKIKVDIPHHELKNWQKK